MKVTATVEFSVYDEHAEELAEMLTKHPCWVDEDFLEKFDVWKEVYSFEIVESKVKGESN